MSGCSRGRRPRHMATENPSSSAPRGSSRLHNRHLIQGTVGGIRALRRRTVDSDLSAQTVVRLFDRVVERPTRSYRVHRGRRVQHVLEMSRRPAVMGGGVGPNRFDRLRGRDLPVEPRGGEGSRDGRRVVSLPTSGLRSARRGGMPNQSSACHPMLPYQKGRLAHFPISSDQRADTHRLISARTCQAGWPRFWQGPRHDPSWISLLWSRGTPPWRPRLGGYCNRAAHRDISVDSILEIAPVLFRDRRGVHSVKLGNADKLVRSNCMVAAEVGKRLGKPG